MFRNSRIPKLLDDVVGPKCERDPKNINQLYLPGGNTVIGRDLRSAIAISLACNYFFSYSYGERTLSNTF